MSRMISFWILVGIIAVIGFLFYQVMLPFVLPLFLAAVLVVMFRPVHRWFLVKCKGRPRLAASLTTAAVMLIVLAPAGVILTSATIEAIAVVGSINNQASSGRLTAEMQRLGFQGEHLKELRYFESAFTQLANGGGSGAPIIVDDTVLDDLHDSLVAFGDTLEYDFEPAAAEEEGQVEEPITAEVEDAAGDTAPDSEPDSGDTAAGDEASQDGGNSAETNADGAEVPENSSTDEGTGEEGATDEGLDEGAETEPKPITAQRKYGVVLEKMEEAKGLNTSMEKLLKIREAAVDFQAFKTRFLFEEFQHARGENAGYLDGMDEPVARLIEFVNPTDEELDEWKNQLFDLGWFRTIGGATSAIVLRTVFAIMIVVIAVYFFLSDGPAMVSSFMRLSPLDDRHEQELLEEFDRASRAVVLATVLSAVVQGLLGGIGYWAAGVGSIFLLTVLTTVFALIPFVGAAAVWVPVSLYLLFVEGSYWSAGLLALYGASIVSTADNVIKPLVLHGQSNLHPLLALLSVLGGVQALGPIGVLVGPMVVVFLQTLLNILHRELTSIDGGDEAE